MPRLDEDSSQDDLHTHIFYGSIVLGIVGVAYGLSRGPKPRPQTRELNGQRVVITGATSGIGRAAAEDLAFKGASLVIGCRDQARGQEVCEVISKASGRPCVARHLDLEDLDSVVAFSESLKGEPVNVLVNNAGAMYRAEDAVMPSPSANSHTGMGKSDDDPTQPHGWDRAMVLNHLSPFLLTHLLLPNLALAASTSQSGEARVVNVGSRLEQSAQLECPLELSHKDHSFHWLTLSPVPYTPMQAYANSKLCLTSQTLHFARSKAILPQGVTCNIVTPGMVHTNLSRFLPTWLGYVSWPIRRMLLRTPEQGAEVVTFAASDASLRGLSGMYLGDNEVIEPSDAAKDVNLGTDIYNASRQLLRHWL